MATAARKSFALGGVAEAATFLLLQRVTRVARALTCSASRLFCSGNSSSRAATLAGKEQEQPPETSLQPPLVWAGGEAPPQVVALAKRSS